MYTYTSKAIKTVRASRIFVIARTVSFITIQFDNRMWSKIFATSPNQKLHWSNAFNSAYVYLILIAIIAAIISPVVITIVLMKVNQSWRDSLLLLPLLSASWREHLLSSHYHVAPSRKCRTWDHFQHMLGNLLVWIRASQIEVCEPFKICQFIFKIKYIMKTIPKNSTIFFYLFEYRNWK